MLTDDELWEKCKSNKAITSEDLGIKKSHSVLTFNKGNNLSYSELRQEIHKILYDFFEHELQLQKEGEFFDFEYLDFRTDDILKLIRKQGGSV